MMVTIRVLVLILYLLSLVSSALAQVPSTMSYQGYLTSSGSAVTASINMTFKIYDVSTGGTALWTETQNGVSVSSGLYSVILGSTTPISLNFDKTYYLEVTVGSDVFTRHQLTASPYAFSSNATVQSYTAGESISADNLLCFDTDIGNAKLYKCDTGDTTRSAIFAGIAVVAASADAAVTVVTNGTYKSSSTPWIANNPVYISSTAGGASTTAASILVGFAISTSVIKVFPTNNGQSPRFNTVTATGTVSANAVTSSGGTITAGGTSQTGSVQVYDGSSNKVTVTSPSIGSDYTLTLPTTDGDADQFLKTNGTGTLSWAAAGGYPTISYATGNVTGQGATNVSAFAECPTNTKPIGGDCLDQDINDTSAQTYVACFSTSAGTCTITNPTGFNCTGRATNPNKITANVVCVQTQ